MDGSKYPRALHHTRPGLGGKLRPLHIDYAQCSARTERTTHWVKGNLIPSAKLKSRGDDWGLFEVCNSLLLFYVVDRLEFSSRFGDVARPEVRVVNLVEGERIDIVSSVRTVELHYAETTVTPAATGPYELLNHSKGRAKPLIAFVRAA